MPNDDDTDQGSTQSEYNDCNEPWKDYVEEKYLLDRDLVLVPQKMFKENIVWDFSLPKTWFNQENYIYPVHSPCGKT